jgi:chromosome segregation ATPase
MSNSRDRDDIFPQIKLDVEDRRTRQTATSSAPTASANPSATSAPVASSGGGKGLATFALLLALASAGAASYLFYELRMQMDRAVNAEQRIAELENKLSATGEEIGDTTVALQVKVTELSNRTNELWDQMDKLWASAWRRNQKEIQDLDSKVDDQVASLRNNVTRVTSTSTSNASSIADARSQVENLNNEILSLSVQLERAAAESGSSRRDLQAATETLTMLEQRNASLVTRMNQLENEIRSIATQMATSSAATTP